MCFSHSTTREERLALAYDQIYNSPGVDVPHKPRWCRPRDQHVDSFHAYILSRRGCSYLKAQEWVLEPHLKAWVLGPSMCKLVLYVQIVTLASTTFILTAMSVDRYLAI